MQLINQFIVVFWWNYKVYEIMNTKQHDNLDSNKVPFVLLFSP